MIVHVLGGQYRRVIVKFYLLGDSLTEEDHLLVGCQGLPDDIKEGQRLKIYHLLNSSYLEICLSKPNLEDNHQEECCLKT